jgi:glutathione S-transferase
VPRNLGQGDNSIIKLYGTSMSRAARSLWAVEELGLKYEHIPTSLPGGTRTLEHLRLNPNGHIPVLDDHGLIVWESMAINLYLAEKYGAAPFWPSDVTAHAHVYQWSLWGMTETESHLLAILMNKMGYPPEQRSQKAVAAAKEALKAPMKVLDEHLKGRQYLLGNDFTIADLNVASVISVGALVQFDMSATTSAQKWLKTCLGRAANQRATQLK